MPPAAAAAAGTWQQCHDTWQCTVLSAFHSLCSGQCNVLNALCQVSALCQCTVLGSCHCAQVNAVCSSHYTHCAQVNAMCCAQVISLTVLASTHCAQAIALCSGQRTMLSAFHLLCLLQQLLLPLSLGSSALDLLSSRHTAGQLRLCMLGIQSSLHTNASGLRDISWPVGHAVQQYRVGLGDVWHQQGVCVCTLSRWAGKHI